MLVKWHGPFEQIFVLSDPEGSIVAYNSAAFEGMFEIVTKWEFWVKSKRMNLSSHTHKSSCKQVKNYVYGF